MKLPFSNPSTRRSPTGYASVISWPSSRTRAEISSAPNAIRFTGRPSSRGSSTEREATIEPFTDIPDHRSAGPLGRRRHAANTRNPYDFVVREHDRPACSAGPRNPRVTKEPFHTTCRMGKSGTHSVAWTPFPHRKSLIRREIGGPDVVRAYASRPVGRFNRMAGCFTLAKEPCGGPEPPVAEIHDPFQRDRRVDRWVIRYPPKHEAIAGRVTMAVNLDATGELHAGPGGAGSGKLCQTKSSATVERHSGTRGDCRPEHTQRS